MRNFWEKFLILPIILVLVCAKSEKRRRSNLITNQCMVYQGGCSYQVSLESSNCLFRDDPNNYKYPPNLSMKSNEIYEKPTPEPSKADLELQKKFEKLETDMKKMMEGLSVRALRHIRGIREDLREITNSMHHLQNGKKKRGLTCPPEFLNVGTWPSCYRLSNFNSTWHEAREYCSAFGADLVALDTMKETYILDYLIKSNPAYEIPKGWWTSGNYIVRNKKWMWTSKHHLKPISFTRWAANEPDARSTMHCMLLYKQASYRWHDAMCTDRHNFICEIHM